MVFALMIEDYTPLRKGTSYSVIEDSNDWIKIKYKGHGMLVPRSFTHPDPTDQLFTDAINEYSEDVSHYEKYAEYYNSIFV